MQVALIVYTPEPELTIAAAAGLSTSPVSALDIREKLTPERVASLLGQLISAGHLFPFQHASFTFAIDGISRVTSHQFVHHRKERVANNVRSGAE